MFKEIGLNEENNAALQRGTSPSKRSATAATALPASNRHQPKDPDPHFRHVGNCFLHSFPKSLAPNSLTFLHLTPVGIVVLRNMKESPNRTTWRSPLNFGSQSPAKVNEAHGAVLHQLLA